MSAAEKHNALNGVPSCNVRNQRKFWKAPPIRLVPGSWSLSMTSSKSQRSKHRGSTCGATSGRWGWWQRWGGRSQVPCTTNEAENFGNNGDLEWSWKPIWTKQSIKGVPVELGIPPGALWRAGAASAIRFKAPSYKCAIRGAEQRFDLKNQLICLFGLAAGLLNSYTVTLTRAEPQKFFVWFFGTWLRCCMLKVWCCCFFDATMHVFSMPLCIKAYMILHACLDSAMEAAKAKQVKVSAAFPLRCNCNL